LIKKFFKRKKRGKSGSYTERKSKLLSWFLFPDNKIGWLPWALAKGYFLCKREKIDLIFSTSPPITSHLTGYLLSLLTKIRWVSDYRDLWGGYQHEHLPSTLHHLLKNKMHKILLKKVDGVIAVNEMISQKLRNIRDRKDNPLTITNGFDQEDFQPEGKPQFDIFRIVYMGTFSSDCNPTPFFAALFDLFKAGLIPKNKTRVIHLGLSMGIDMEKLLLKYDLKDVFEEKGYVPHKQAVALLQSAHIFLLTIAHSKQRELITTGKIFEYMAARRPILAVVPPKGSAAQFVNRLNAGKVVSPDNIPEIKEGLFHFYQKFENKKIVSDVKREDLKSFERKDLTHKLAKLLDCIWQKG
jgi:glycosyltransferase involved in cell wall biosynthesis